ncbi:MAG: sulfate ABC transporter substrate-binding protein [Pedobacter sp.]|nr:sulfate ABC transporter substrate-binding protein [Pedobacter sp.]
MKKNALRLALAAAAFSVALPAAAGTTLLNVSYDVTREFFKDYNEAFIAYWQKKGGETLTINQSHGGSSKQARAVADGLEADVVTMNQSNDIDILADKELLPKDWIKKYKDNSSPFTSTIVFLVRKGNPKAIKDWDDLVKPGTQVIIPNPKTSGNGRYTYLAAWVYAKQKSGNDVKAIDFEQKLFGNVPVLDTGGRGATTTFAQRGIGDVLVTFENEAFLTQKELPDANLEIVYPSISILAEPPVAVVDKFASKHGTVKQSRAYLEYLYSPEGQKLAAKHFLRPRDQAVLKQNAAIFKPLKLVSIDELGGWKKVQGVHFADGGLFDQIYIPAK